MEWIKEAKQALGEADLNLTAGTFKIVFVNSSHTLNNTYGGDEYLSDITAGNRLHTETLSSVTFTSGVLDAADVTITDPGGGTTCTQYFLYKDTGVESTSRLVGVTTGVSYTFDGQNDSITWDAAGILTLES